MTSFQYRTGRSRILSATFPTPVAKDNDAVLAAVTDNGSEQVITSGLTDPDVPRVVTATAGGTSTDIAAIQVKVEGVNVWGQTLTETLPAFTVDTAGTVTGSKAFLTVTKVTIPAHDGTGATTSVGVNEKLGLPVNLDRDTLVASYVGGTKEGTRASLDFDADEVSKNLVDFSGDLDGSTDVVADYYK